MPTLTVAKYSALEAATPRLSTDVYQYYMYGELGRTVASPDSDRLYLQHGHDLVSIVVSVRNGLTREQFDQSMAVEVLLQSPIPNRE